MTFADYTMPITPHQAEGVPGSQAGSSRLRQTRRSHLLEMLVINEHTPIDSTIAHQKASEPCHVGSGACELPA
jgi:hypothetical protein